MFTLHFVLITCLQAPLSVCRVPFSYQSNFVFSMRLFVLFVFVVRGLSFVSFFLLSQQLRFCYQKVRCFPCPSLALSAALCPVSQSSSLSGEPQSRGELGGGRGGGLHRIVGGVARPGAAGGGVWSRRCWWRLRSGAAGGGAWLGGAGGGVCPGAVGAETSGVAAGGRALFSGAGDLDGIIGDVVRPLLFHTISDVRGLNDGLFFVRAYLLFYHLSFSIHGCY